MVKLYALFKINLLTNMRYRLNFFSFSIGMVLPVIPILALLLFQNSGQIFGFSSIMEYIEYVLIGITVWGFIETLWSFVFRLRAQMREGIFEETLLMPLSPFDLIFGWSSDGFLTTLVQSIPLVMGSIFFLTWKIEVLKGMAIFIILVLSLIGSFSFSLMLVGLMLMHPDTDQLVSFLGNITPFICGLYVPLTVIPGIFRSISYVLPFTWGLDLIRFYSFQHEPFLPAALEWQLLISLVVLYLIAGSYIYQRLEKRARKKNQFISY